jgi:hypothetical protein
MSYTDLDALEPVPGDLIVARVAMRAWEDDSRRGTNGEVIQAGEQAMVVQTWEVGNQRRMRVIHDQRLLVFSCAAHVVRRNWKVAGPAPRVANLWVSIVLFIAR